MLFALMLFASMMANSNNDTAIIPAVAGGIRQIEQNISPVSLRIIDQVLRSGLLTYNGLPFFGENYILVYALGDSMFPRGIRDGDVLWCLPFDSTKGDNLIKGDIMVIKNPLHGNKTWDYKLREFVQFDQEGMIDNITYEKTGDLKPRQSHKHDPKNVIAVVNKIILKEHYEKLLCHPIGALI